MKVSVQDGGPCRKVLQVSDSSDAVAEEYKNVLAEFSKFAKVPGFREGNAPVSVIEKRFAKKITDETRDRLVPLYYRKALEQEGLHPVAVINVGDVSFSKDSGIDFNVTIDVPPKFKLPKYKKITVKGSQEDIDEKTVDESYTRILEASSMFEDVEGRPAARGDLAMIDYTGTTEGKSIAELVKEGSPVGAGKDFWTLLGDPEFVPGIADAVAGMNIDESRKINIHFPDDYVTTELSGIDAEYDVTLKGLREKKLPEVNEEFLKRFDVKTDDELKERIRDDLRKNEEQKHQNELKNQIVQFLVEKTSIDLPESVVQQETHGIVQDSVRRMAMGGASKEQIQGQQQSILDAATQSSTERVKVSYILNRISEEESITVEESEMDDRVAALAMQYRMPVSQFKEELQKRNAMESIRSDLRNEKTLDFLLENAKIKK